MIGETPTTRPGAAASASRMPGTASTGPIDTIGFDGATSTTSAAAIASTTPGAGRACVIPGFSKRCGSSFARWRVHHS